MDLIAPLVRRIVAPAWARWERSPYLKHYRSLLRTQYDPPETIRRRQLQQLKQLLTEAKENTHFWSDRFRQAGLNPNEFQSFDELQQLPPLTKDDLRNHCKSMISRRFNQNSLQSSKTSGSTGVPVEVFYNESTLQFRRACLLRSDEWSGWRLGERVASVWGNPELRTDWRGRLRRSFLERHFLFLDTLKMSDEDLTQFVFGLVRTPASLLFGHAHSLYLVANFIEEKHPGLRIRPKGIISTCMVLHDFEREKIEEVFACPVTDRYGCEEVSLIASQCERHEGLHVNSDSLFLEIVDENGRLCEPGQSGRILVTDLTNPVMPMIRYEVGDMASWDEKPCSCARTLPLLKRIAGRVADYVITSNGDRISGISLTENFAQQVPGVAQMQIVQEDLDRFVYNIVRSPDFDTKSLQCIQKLTLERFGPMAEFECKFIERIPQEPSGKYRFCISKVRR